jgi:hypothetical protein
MSIWPKDNTEAKNAFYGNFLQKGWDGLNLVKVIPPFQMYYDKHPIASIRVHKKISSAVFAALNEIAEKCEHDQKKIDATGISDYGGCWNIRKIAGDNNWSNHSWACALDFSPSTNGFNMKGNISNIVVEAFKRQGALWGGDYKGRKDPMHFEFVSR